MNLDPVTALLRQRIGLEPKSLGATTLARAVTARMRALGMTAPELYAARLARDAQEFQLLVGDIVVPETWFFRGGEIFAYLARRVADAVRLRAPFRILSVPCSSGEEPYSLAIALAEAGVAPDAWDIEGVDLSAQHIEMARRARFGNFSFRQTPPELRRRYFRAVEGGWELDAGIRSRVCFRQGNLLSPLFLGGEEPFDLILCRNLFIYLHAEARRDALHTVVRLLAPDGLFCTGHADPLDFPNWHFTRTGPEGYFLYSRLAKSGRETRAERSAGEAAGFSVATAAPHHLATSPPHQSLSASGAAEPASPIDFLRRARQEADSGRLNDALNSCQEQLTRFGPSADLYSLMGVIHQARREKDQAVRCYRQALYLEREHPEALAHLMLLVQEQGDEAQAERLRRRLDRVAARRG